MKYKRILVKISGEMLSGDSDKIIDRNLIKYLANEIKPLMKQGVQVVVLPGGGNWIRGADFAGDGIERSTADYMGMLAGVINGQLVMDILMNEGIQTRAMSAIRMEQICEPFIRRKAVRHLEKGRLVIVTGGTGKPYYTHDTAAAAYALELGCELVIKSTKVDGVYDKDPNEDESAKKYEQIDYQTLLENPAVQVMDKAALGLMSDQKMPLVVCNLSEAGTLRKIVDGEQIGTLVS